MSRFQHLKGSIIPRNERPERHEANLCFLCLSVPVHPRHREPEALISSASPVHRIWFQKGETIVHEGTPFTGWAVLCHGPARLTVSAEKGKRLLLHFCKPGDLLAASISKPPSFSATAVPLCAVAFLTQKHVLDFGRRYPEMLLQVHQRFEEIQRHLAMKLVDLAYGSVRQRLVHVLLRLGEEHGVLGGRAGCASISRFPSRTWRR